MYTKEMVITRKPMLAILECRKASWLCYVFKDRQQNVLRDFMVSGSDSYTRCKFDRHAKQEQAVPFASI